jgi:hypothetical protein
MRGLRTHLGCRAEARGCNKKEGSDAKSRYAILMDDRMVICLFAHL